MKKTPILLALIILLSSILVGCSKKDKDTDSDGINGIYQVTKVEMGAMNFFEDVTDLFITDDCERSAKINFQGTSFTVINTPECLGDEDPFEGSFTLNGNKIESDLFYINGEIVTNNGNSLVLETTYQQATLRIHLTKQ